LAEKRWETYFLSKDEKVKWMKNYVGTEPTVARMRVQDAETAIIPEQEHMRYDEKIRLTTTIPETTFEEMLNAIGDIRSHHASSDNPKYGQDKDDEEYTELGKLSELDEPGWQLGTSSKTVQHHMESCRQ
jgi:hypothetical protein